MNIAKSLRTPIENHLQMTASALEAFCIMILLILAMRMLHLFGILEDYVAAAYQLLNYNCILAYVISFSNRWEQPQSVS